MNNCLEVDNLVVRRDRKTVLQVGHLTVSKGEALAVIGPNGAGKSTMLLALARLLKPAQGRLVFDGQPVESMPDLAYRRRIGLVLQEPLLLDRSVFENVALGLHFRKTPNNETARRVDEWLERLQISHLRQRNASRISGGEAQRVSLARAFVLEPELLLLDEPFSALDAPTRNRLLDDLSNILKQTSTTTVFITHDLNEASRIGQRLAVILDGRLQQWGTPKEVYSHPVNPAVAAFLGLPHN
ncbi:MAG: ABC transporter ATP-binding protein [Chloroflexi bacterium]|nr:ABC transporter ATP-binding protein [Chloroflexota bacterium]